MEPETIDDALWAYVAARSGRWKQIKYLVRTFWILRFAADLRSTRTRARECVSRVLSIPRDEDKACAAWTCAILFSETAEQVPPGTLDKFSAWIARYAGCSAPLAPGHVFDAVHRSLCRITDLVDE